MFKQINFCYCTTPAGRHGAVVQHDFNIKLEKLIIQVGGPEYSGARVTVAYAKRISQSSDPIISKYMNRPGLTQRHMETPRE